MKNSTTFLEQLLNWFLFTRHNSCTNAGQMSELDFLDSGLFYIQVVLLYVCIISLGNSYIESETLSEYETDVREVM